MLVLALCPPVLGWAKTPDGAACEETAPATAAPQEEKVQEKAAAEEKGKEEAKEDGCPATFGPIITDTAVPIDTGKFCVQPTYGLGFVTNSLTQNWRRVSAGGNFKNFSMNYKFTYGLIKNLEVYTVIPYLHNWANSVKEPGPNGERSASFGGLGNVSLTLKYQLLEEGPKNPTVTALFTTGFPTGHCRHLNPGRLDTDLLGGGGLRLHHRSKPVQVRQTLHLLCQCLVYYADRLHQ